MFHCKSRLFTISGWTLLRLPLEVSSQLPSRGQTMIKGTVNDVPFQTALEPDGRGSHWFRVDSRLQTAAKVKAGDVATLAIEPAKEWPEPVVPADLKAILAANPPVQALWMKITPMARWEWIRWIGSTGNEETRARRIKATRSKLMAGERRPCCFNRNMCCVPRVSKNGVLLTLQDGSKRRY